MTIHKPMKTPLNEKEAILATLYKLLSLSEAQRVRRDLTALNRQEWCQVSVTCGEAILTVSETLQVKLSPRVQKFIRDSLSGVFRNSKAKTLVFTSIGTIKGDTLKASQIETSRQHWCLICIESAVVLSRVLAKIGDE